MDSTFNTSHQSTTQLIFSTCISDFMLGYFNDTFGQNTSETLANLNRSHTWTFVKSSQSTSHQRMYLFPGNSLIIQQTCQVCHRATKTMTCTSKSKQEVSPLF
uniref:Uncharacterized protein n=1 Tax=Cacopsylla melanoneura TaxID=428564 RepID=A0A8D9AR79_9HEMI